MIPASFPSLTPAPAETSAQATPLAAAILPSSEGDAATDATPPLETTGGFEAVLAQVQPSEPAPQILAAAPQDLELACEDQPPLAELPPAPLYQSRVIDLHETQSAPLSLTAAGAAVEDEAPIAQETEDKPLEETPAALPSGPLPDRLLAPTAPRAFEAQTIAPQEIAALDAATAPQKAPLAIPPSAQPEAEFEALLAFDAEALASPALEGADADALRFDTSAPTLNGESEEASLLPAAPERTKAAPSTSVTRNILDRLDQIELQEGRTKVLLRPQGLGLLEIDLARLIDNRLQLTLRVDNPMTLELLRQDGAALSDFLSERGFDLSGGEPQFERYEAPSEAEDASSEPLEDDSPSASPAAPRLGAGLNIVT